MVNVLTSQHCAAHLKFELNLPILNSVLSPLSFFQNFQLETILFIEICIGWFKCFSPIKTNLGQF